MNYGNTFYFQIPVIDLGVIMSKKPPRCSPQIFARDVRKEKKEKEDKPNK